MDLTIGKSRFDGKTIDLMDFTMKEKWKVAENTMESYHEIMLQNSNDIFTNRHSPLHQISSSGKVL